MITNEKYASVPHVKEGVKGILGQWMGKEEAEKETQKRLVSCMKGEKSPSDILLIIMLHIFAPCL